jgi:hypothetical protein
MARVRLYLFEVVVLISSGSCLWVGCKTAAVGTSALEGGVSLSKNCAGKVTKETPAVVYKNGAFGLNGSEFEVGDEVETTSLVQEIKTNRINGSFAEVKASYFEGTQWVKISDTNLETKCSIASGAGTNSGPSDSSGNHEQRLEPDTRCVTKIIGRPRAELERDVADYCSLLTQVDHELIEPAFGQSIFALYPQSKFQLTISFVNDAESNGNTPLPPTRNSIEIFVGRDIKTQQELNAIVLHEFGHHYLHNIPFRKGVKNVNAVFQTAADEFFADVFSVFAANNLKVQASLSGSLRDFAVNSTCNSLTDSVLHTFFAPSKSAIRQVLSSVSRDRRGNFLLEFSKKLPEVAKAGPFDLAKCEHANNAMVQLIKDCN